MNYKTLLLIVMLLLSLNVKSQKHTPLTYISKYDSLSLSLTSEHKIPTSIILGISMLESGYGTSKLSINKHNFFGVKKGKYYGKYENDTASFRDFCYYISKRKYYDFLTKNNITDYKIWLINIRKGGYSASKSWATKVLFYIKKYELYEYD